MIEADDEGAHGWEFGVDRLTAHLGLVALSAWRARNQYQAWPTAGGWLDQPLWLLVHFQALDLVEHTTRYMNAKNSDWNKLSALQSDVMRWLETDERPS